MSVYDLMVMVSSARRGVAVDGDVADLVPEAVEVGGGELIGRDAELVEVLAGRGLEPLDEGLVRDVDLAHVALEVLADQVLRGRPAAPTEHEGEHAGDRHDRSE